MTNCSLVIFTCEGKDHLLAETFTSFKQRSSYAFDSVILALDGKVDPKVIELINPDIVIQNYSRRGYVSSIINALTQINTEFFFWLEDDFEFKQDVPLARMESVLTENKDWSGIFLSRTAPLTSEEKALHHFEDYYSPSFGFSVSPSFCRTRFVKDAFEALKNHPKDSSTKLYGFETFLDDYFKKNALKYALIDPGQVPHVEHVGKLESTAREYHMINSLDSEKSDVGKDYISGFGYEAKVPLKSKVAIIPKLLQQVGLVLGGVFSSRKSYDMAFRIYLTLSNFNKSR